MYNLQISCSKEKLACSPATHNNAILSSSHQLFIMPYLKKKLRSNSKAIAKKPKLPRYLTFQRQLNNSAGVGVGVVVVVQLGGVGFWGAVMHSGLE